MITEICSLTIHPRRFRMLAGESKVNLKLSDAVLFEYLRKMQDALEVRRWTDGQGQCYFEISHRFLMESFPLLGISDRSSLALHLDRLERAGLISCLKNPHSKSVFLISVE